MNNLKTKTFYQALLQISHSPLKAKSYLQDKRLTQLEKKILHAYFLFRDGKFTDVICQIESLEVIEPEILAQKNLLLGLAFNNLTQFNLANEFYQRALIHFKELKLPYFYHLTLVNQFYLALTCFDQKLINSIGKKMEMINLSNTSNPVRILRCLYHYYRINAKTKEANAIHSKLFLQFKTFSEADQLNFLMDYFQKSLIEKKYHDCYEALGHLKKLKKYYSSENYKFMFKILSFIDKGAPIYFQQKDFEKVPFLEEQMNCLRALEEGDSRKAELHWNNLSHQMNMIYLKPFQFNGDDCLFKFALNKLVKNHLSEVKPLNLEGLSVKEKILTVLKHAKNNVPQDILFELVWGRKPLNKNDYQILSKALYKMKKEKSVEIQCHKKCYFLKAS